MWQQVVWAVLTVWVSVGVAVLIVRHDRRKQLEERRLDALDAIEDRMAELAEVDMRMALLQERLEMAEQALLAQPRREG